jgi:hypothetical protein
MGSRAALAFEAKRSSEASRFVRLVVGARRSAGRSGVLGCQAHAFVMKLAARTLAFAAKGERDAVCILSPVAAGDISSGLFQ